jgi:hypothetical protein
MPDESLLRDKARECVEQRKLPNRKPDRMWGGKGLGDSSCVVCNLIVSRDEVELEIEFDVIGRTPRVVMHHIHVCCFSAWELVRTKVDGHPPI